MARLAVVAGQSAAREDRAVRRRPRREVPEDLRLPVLEQPDRLERVRVGVEQGGVQGVPVLARRGGQLRHEVQPGAALLHGPAARRPVLGGQRARVVDPHHQGVLHPRGGGPAVGRLGVLPDHLDGAVPRGHEQARCHGEALCPVLPRGIRGVHPVPEEVRALVLALQQEDLHAREAGRPALLQLAGDKARVVRARSCEGQGALAAVVDVPALGQRQALRDHVGPDLLLGGGGGGAPCGARPPGGRAGHGGAHQCGARQGEEGAAGGAAPSGHLRAARVCPGQTTTAWRRAERRALTPRHSVTRRGHRELHGARRAPPTARGAGSGCGGRTPSTAAPRARTASARSSWTRSGSRPGCCTG